MYIFTYMSTGGASPRFYIVIKNLTCPAAAALRVKTL